MKNKIGIIEVTVKLFLETDVDQDTAQEIVENMDYECSHGLISHTEITGDDIEYRCSQKEREAEEAYILRESGMG